MAKIIGSYGSPQASGVVQSGTQDRTLDVLAQLGGAMVQSKVQEIWTESAMEGAELYAKEIITNGKEGAMARIRQKDKDANYGMPTLATSGAAMSAHDTAFRDNVMAYTMSEDFGKDTPEVAKAKLIALSKHEDPTVQSMLQQSVMQAMPKVLDKHYEAHDAYTQEQFAVAAADRVVSASKSDLPADAGAVPQFFKEPEPGMKRSTWIRSMQLAGEKFAQEKDFRSALEVAKHLETMPDAKPGQVAAVWQAYDRNTRDDLLNSTWSNDLNQRFHAVEAQLRQGVAPFKTQKELMDWFDSQMKQSTDRYGQALGPFNPNSRGRMIDAHVQGEMFKANQEAQRRAERLAAANKPLTPAMLLQNPQFASMVHTALANGNAGAVQAQVYALTGGAVPETTFDSMRQAMFQKAFVQNPADAITMLNIWAGTHVVPKGIQEQARRGASELLSGNPSPDAQFLVSYLSNPDAAVSFEGRLDALGITGTQAARVKFITRQVGSINGLADPVKLSDAVQKAQKIEAARQEGVVIEQDLDLAKESIAKAYGWRSWKDGAPSTMSEERARVYASKIDDTARILMVTKSIPRNEAYDRATREVLGVVDNVGGVDYKRNSDKDKSLPQKLTEMGAKFKFAIDPRDNAGIAEAVQADLRNTLAASSGTAIARDAELHSFELTPNAVLYTYSLNGNVLTATVPQNGLAALLKDSKARKAATEKHSFWGSRSQSKPLLDIHHPSSDYPMFRN